MYEKHKKLLYVFLCASLLLNCFTLYLCTRGGNNNQNGAGNVSYHSQQLGNIQQKQDTALGEARETNREIRETTNRISEIEQSDGARIAELKRILQGVQQRMQKEAPNN